jgi:hypothetical protein
LFVQKAARNETATASTTTASTTTTMAIIATHTRYTCANENNHHYTYCFADFSKSNFRGLLKNNGKHHWIG